MPDEGGHPELVGPYRRARRAAYGPGEFVDQQGFMPASGIRDLAAAADIGPGTRVLDLCCGRGGPGRLITRERGCELIGVDADASAVALARDRARVEDLTCRYEVVQIPPVARLLIPPVDVVLLLETMLAFRDKQDLLREIRSSLAPGGRFAFTVEEGAALTDAERHAMPAADTVWPVPLPRLRELLEESGFEGTWQQEVTTAHRDVVDALVVELARHRGGIVAQVGAEEHERMLAAHRLWSQWLRTGRIRKFAVVAAAQSVQRADSA